MKMLLVLITSDKKLICELGHTVMMHVELTPTSERTEENVQ